MSEADTLKEYLVALGFKIDTSSYKRFQDATKQSTLDVAKLGLSVVSAAAAVAGFTTTMADAFEKLYYAAQRTGSTILGIKSTDYAISQLGGSADAAQSSLENLGHFMRSYPGAGGFLEKLGVKPENIHDAAAALKDLQKFAHDTPFWQAQPYANLLGIDEKTWLALSKGEYGQRLEEYNQKVKEAGIDMADAGNKGVAMMQALRSLGAEAEIVGVALEQGLGKPLVHILETLTAILAGFAKFAANPSATGNSALNAIGSAGSIIGSNSVKQNLSNVGSGIAQGVGTLGDYYGISKLLKGPRGIRNNNPGNLRSWGNQPRVDGYATFGTSFDGLSAEAKQLLRYSDRGLNTLRSIVSTWAPGSDHNDVEAYVKSLEQSTGFGGDQKLNLHDQASLEKVMRGINKHENGIDPYGSNLYSAAASYRLGGGVSQTNTANITVHGSTNPAATAGAIGSKMNEIYKQWQRNGQTAAQ